jgi:cysteine-rich repeat protein
MIDIRRTSLCLTCLAVLACGLETPPADEAGSTTDPGDSGTETTTETGSDTETDTGSDTETGSDSVCGDGAIDPGEVCDDANLDDGDGCTSSCEIGPCGFEWLAHEPAVVVDSFGGIGLVDGALELATTRLASLPALTQLTRVSTSGTVDSTLDLSDVIGDEYLIAIVEGPGGDRFAATNSLLSFDARVRRLSAEDNPDVLWEVTVPTMDGRVDLASTAGHLAIVLTTELDNTNHDATVIALDADDGSELWSHDLGGQPGANGYSLDRAGTLAIHDTGRVFAGITEYIGSDTTAATVAAFASDGGDPLWVTRAVDVPGEHVESTALTLGPDGTVYLTAQSYDEYFESYLVALEPETGSVEWMFDYDDIPIGRIWATALGVSVSTDRILTTGYWSYIEDNQQVAQAYAMGFDLDGARVCIGTYDTYPPPNPDELMLWAPQGVTVGQQGEFYLGGVAVAAVDNSTSLFAARIR